jgi:predicted metallopeptidase
MNKLIVVFLILITIGVSILAVSDEREEYFKKVELPTNNLVINHLDHLRYYDTILTVGMDLVGIDNVTVVITSMNESAKKQFEGELKAHIRFINGIYYLFIGEYTRREAVKIISHEIVHIQQYKSRELIYENGELMWHNQLYSVEEEYKDRPWEIDAFNKQDAIKALILNTLYK